MWKRAVGVGTGHLVQMTEQAEAGHIGAGVHRVTVGNLGRVLVERGHGLDRQRKRLVRGRAHACRRAGQTHTERLRRTSASPTCPVLLARMRSGWMVPVTDRPYLTSLSAIE